MTLQPPKNPLLIAGLALGAFWLWKRSAAAAVPPGQVVGRRSALPVGGSAIVTPTDVAAALARQVVGWTKGVRTGGEPANNTGRAVWNDLSVGEKVAYQQGAYGLPASWSGASPSGVAPVLTYSGGDPYAADVDSIPAAPVYDITTDFVKNPFTAWQP